MYSRAGKTIRCSEVYRLRLSDNLRAASTIAHIERPGPLPIGQPLPLENWSNTGTRNFDNNGSFAAFVCACMVCCHGLCASAL